MKREMYNDICTGNSHSISKHINGNIIEDYKDNDTEDDLSTDISNPLLTAKDGDEIDGVKVSQKKKGMYLEFQDGTTDGPYQKIEYNQDEIYCTIIFNLAYKYERNGLLGSIGSSLAYYTYIKQFIETHTEAYKKFKEANKQFEKDMYITHPQRWSLFQIDYRSQRRQALATNARNYSTDDKKLVQLY